MKRLLWITITVLLLSMYFVNSVSIFLYNETDHVKLEPIVEDPDNQELEVRYDPPLNKSGEWKTTYGDEGKYESKITVSDGDLTATERIIIVIQKKEEKPVIELIEPNFKDVIVDEGSSIIFIVNASDLNNDLIRYVWFVDNNEVFVGTEFHYNTLYGDGGEHEILIKVSDGVFNVTNSWNVFVREVNILGLLDEIEDVNLQETEEVVLSLPDFGSYGLEYQISEPIGNDNSWITDYDSEGEYLIDIDVEGKGFSGTKQVKVVVENKDRPTKFIMEDVYFTAENEEIQVEIELEDPDGGDIILFSEDLPEGAKLDDNIFTWKPGFDAVNKDNSFDYVLDKLRLLVGSYDIKFYAETEQGSTEKSVRLIVQDVNRPFDFEDLEDIVVQESDIIKIEPKYTDEDGDSVKFSYSGWMTSNIYRTDYDDAGEYFVKVTGSDGFNTIYKFVKVIVEERNRLPEFKKIRDQIIEEGSRLELIFEAEDPDNDEISFSSLFLPEGAKIIKNKFVWTPGYDIVKNKTKENIEFTFIVNDGKEEVAQNVTITVFNKNRAPEFVDAKELKKVKVGEPVEFWIDVVDPDEDELSYVWDFGFFEKYDATPLMERTFTSKGNKKVKVTVTDDKEEVFYEWDVRVV